MTRKEQIIDYLKARKKLTCGELCGLIILDEALKGNKARYLSGSISSILAKMVKEGILEYAPYKGPKGGHVYQMKTKP